MNSIQKNILSYLKNKETDLGFSITHIEPEYVIFINSKFGFKALEKGVLSTSDNVFNFMQRCVDIEDDGMGFFIISIAKPKGFDQKDIRIFVSKYEPFVDSEIQNYVVDKDLNHIQHLEGIDALEALLKTHKLEFTYDM